MNNKFYVSLEVARLLKEKGYNEECEQIIKEDGETLYGYNVNYKLPVTLFSCPTKAEAIDWLESKGIVVVLCRVTPIYMAYAGEKDWSFDLELKESGKYDGCLRFLTRLEAEEAAIIKALELL